MSSLPGFPQSRKATSDAPKGMVLVITGLGIHPGSFSPRQFGEKFEPSPVLQSQMGHAGNFTVFFHMDHPSIFTKHGGIKSLYNGSLIKKSAGPRIVSVDQVAASAYKNLPCSIIRKSDWKSIQFLKDGKTELYNLRADLKESDNLAEKNPAQTKALLEELTQWRRANKAPFPPNSLLDY